MKEDLFWCISIWRRDIVLYHYIIKTLRQKHNMSLSFSSFKRILLNVCLDAAC